MTDKDDRYALGVRNVLRAMEWELARRGVAMPRKLLAGYHQAAADLYGFEHKINDCYYMNKGAARKIKQVLAGMLRLMPWRAGGAFFEEKMAYEWAITVLDNWETYFPVQVGRGRRYLLAHPAGERSAAGSPSNQSCPSAKTASVSFFDLN
jgi:hypothetical protein